MFSKGLKALQILADVTKDEDCRRIVETVVCRLGRIDILVNNAGAGAFGSIYDPKLMQTFDHMMKLDVRSVVCLQITNFKAIFKTSFDF